MDDTIDTKQFVLVMRQIAEEKNLQFDVVQDALEQALAAAWRKDYGSRDQNVRTSLNPNSGDFRVWVVKEVVKEVEDPELQISLEEAKKTDPKAKVGGTVEFEQKPKGFGRVAAQTAKQVILQKLREAEREVVHDEYSGRIGTILNATVQRIEPRVVYLDLGKAQGILPASEQIPGEHYSSGQRIKAYLRDVEMSARGPQLVLSRANADFISLLFKREVPEMENGAVEIKEIAREAGVRTKLAVASNVPGVDPVGTYVGGHGTRVQAVMNEVGEEKIDIIMYAEDPQTFITNALSPTKISKVKLSKKEQKAEVVVPEDQLSVAIGKNGQNVRLASKLTGWQIDIVSEDGTAKSASPEEAEAPAKPKKLASKQELESNLIESIASVEEEAEPTPSAATGTTATVDDSKDAGANSVNETVAPDAAKEPADAKEAVAGPNEPTPSLPEDTKDSGKADQS